jgi:hypothetical protein
VDRGSVADISLFRPIDNTTTPKQTPIVDLTLDINKTMTVENTLSNPSGVRPPVRMDAQEGPWSISVAETPHDAHSYSLYIRSESITYYSTFSQFLVSLSMPLYYHVSALENKSLITIHDF